MLLDLLVFHLRGRAVDFPAHEQVTFLDFEVGVDLQFHLCYFALCPLTFDYLPPFDQTVLGKRLLQHRDGS